MKNAILPLIAALTVTFVQPASAATSDLEASLVKVCAAVKSNSKFRLQNVLESHRMDYKLIAEGLMCNGQDVYTFAQAHGANKTAQLIASRAKLDENALLAKR